MNKVIFLVAAILFSLCTRSFANEGQKIFKANCAVCHSVGKGKVVGPDLKGVETRHDIAWLLKWIKSSQAMVKSGDKTAVQLFNENDNLVMQDFSLTDDEIKSVLEYVKETEQQQLISAQNAAAENSAASKNKATASNSSMLSVLGFSGYIMVMLIGLFVLVIWVMSMSIKKITIDIKEKNKS